MVIDAISKYYIEINANISNPFQLNNYSVISRIRDCRINNNYSIEQWAFLVRLTPRIIEAWEESEELEKLKKYFELANILNCSVDELMDVENKKENLPSHEFNQLIEEENNDIS